MKVYNVMCMTRCDYDFSVLTHQEGCYYNKEDAIKRKDIVITEIKNACVEEIKEYSNKNKYQDVGVGALYVENDEMYFEMQYGFEDDHAVHQVWIDELEVK